MKNTVVLKFAWALSTWGILASGYAEGGVLREGAPGNSSKVLSYTETLHTSQEGALRSPVDRRVTEYTEERTASPETGRRNPVDRRVTEYTEVQTSNGILRQPRQVLAYTETLRTQLKNELRNGREWKELRSAPGREDRLVEYQTGKNSVDQFGQRVRIEEYVLRPRADQFEYMVFNRRDNRLDYGTVLKTYNQSLPGVLSGFDFWSPYNAWVNAVPGYFVTEEDVFLSNGRDSFHRYQTGGALSQTTFDDGKGPQSLTVLAYAHSGLELNGKTVADLRLASSHQETTSACLEAGCLDGPGSLAVGDTRLENRATTWGYDADTGNLATSAITYEVSDSAGPLRQGNVDVTFNASGYPVTKTETVVTVRGEGPVRRGDPNIGPSQLNIAPSVPSAPSTVVARRQAGFTTKSGDAFSVAESRVDDNGSLYKTGTALNKYNLETVITADAFQGRTIDLLISNNPYTRSLLETSPASSFIGAENMFNAH